MATNHFFKNFNSFPQQELVNSLSKEVIQIAGLDVLYLPRFDSYAKDTLLNEDALIEYNKGYQVEMYVNTPDGYGGSGDTLSKFGLDVQDEIILIVNKERFKDETFIDQPREGDLIYFPLGKTIFTIKYVEHEQPFYTLGKTNVFEITAETFRYSNERFNLAGEEAGEIFNKIERDNATTVEFTVTSGSSIVFRDGETIFQGNTPETATAMARVSKQEANKIYVYRVQGQFVLNELVTGIKSLTSAYLTGIDDQIISTSEFDDYKEFEVEGDDILDFSEIDPWSEGDI